MSINRIPIAFLLLSLLIAAAGSRAAGTALQAETQAVIEALQLTEAASPIADNPRWQPRRIVITLPPRFSEAMPELEAQLLAAAGETEVVFDRSGSFVPGPELLQGADAVIGLCTPPLLAGADPRLLWLHNYSVGMDRCTGLSDKQLAQIVFTNNKRLSSPTIAEHSIAMLLAIARGLPAYGRAQAENRWDREIAGEVQFGELEGKTLLVVGLGGIGTEIARRAHGLGMRVTAIRNSSRKGPRFVDYVGLPEELHTLAGKADVVANALPLTTETTGLFDAAFFNALKPGAIFISVGRGKSTVTADLIQALKTGRLYGAGLDVTDPEPLPAESPLWQMDNVIITPHVSGTGAPNIRRTALIAVENLRRYVAGEPLLNVVDMRAGY
jgi:phosphoglycerate dehydrogenase-like enzyme